MQAKVLTKDEARRHFPDPPIAPEVPSRHAQKAPSLLAGQPTLLVLLKRFLKPRHKNLP
jgi:hypothetical protein